MSFRVAAGMYAAKRLGADCLQPVRWARNGAVVSCCAWGLLEEMSVVVGEFVEVVLRAMAWPTFGGPPPDWPPK